MELQRITTAEQDVCELLEKLGYDVSIVETSSEDVDLLVPQSDLKPRPIFNERQCSDASYTTSSTADEGLDSTSWKSPSKVGIAFFYLLFILAPFSFAADDLFASFVDGIMRCFGVDEREAQRLAYHWDSISFGVASIGAPLSAMMCSFWDPAIISVFGSFVACGGLGLVLQGFVVGNQHYVLTGLGIRSNGSEIQIQALFPIIKRWTLGLKLADEGASAVYMERAVAFVNASILLVMAIGPLLALSHSLDVIIQGLSSSFGLCGLSMLILALVSRPKRPSAVVTQEHPQVVEPLHVRSSVRSFIKSKLAQTKAMLRYIWIHPLALLTLLQRNIILVLQEQAAKGFATVLLPLGTSQLSQDYLGRLILIIPAFCTVAVTILYTVFSHHCVSFDRYTKRWNAFLLCGCMLFTCLVWHFLTRAGNDRLAITLIVLMGIGRGLASCLISYPVGLAYDGDAELVNPSNFMPLVSNILMNCIFSFTGWFMLAITKSSSEKERLYVFSMSPFWGYIAMSGLFLLQGLLLKYSHIFKKSYIRAS